MSIDAGTKEQAAEALRKVMHERCSNFDRGAVVHWAERGYYVTAAEITALRARLEAVEKERDELEAELDKVGATHLQVLSATARAERAEAALALRNGECEAKKIIITQLEATLATARRDALGLCRDIAMQALTGDADGRDIYEQIDALANEAET